MQRKAIHLAVGAALFTALLGGCSNGIASNVLGTASVQQPGFARSLTKPAPIRASSAWRCAA